MKKYEKAKGASSRLQRDGIRAVLFGVLVGVASCAEPTTFSTTGLVATSPEAAGDNCEVGGTRLDFGSDDNGNGVLDADEIDETRYLCHETDGEQGETGASGGDGEDFQTLVEASDEAPGANCAEGGHRVDFGIDDNRDGILDAGEIDGTTFVCNGATGGDTLIASSDEPAGANCAAGGARLDHGVDDSGDGVLDADEIDGTFFVCDGVDGIAGLDSLVATSEELAGANCANGGQRVDQGLDDSRDGVLDADEIDKTTFVCDADDGANGLDALVLVSAEAAGANCVNGGTRIESGTDISDDGVLDAVEVTSTSFACNGLRTLVFSSDIAAGGACGALTGSQIDMGLDLNGDGALQAPEVTTTAVACEGAAGLNGTDGANGSDGADGFDALVTQTAIGAGGVCGAATGVRVDSGLDTNRSGVLDAAEVVTTNELCNGLDGADGANGADGADGADGPTGLVLLTDEAAGGNCSEGGTRVDSGLDTNLSGILDAGEITSTAFVCNGVEVVPNLLSNGSFETGDFTGWTLFQPNGFPEAHVIVPDGATINDGDLLFDFFDGIDENIDWCGVAPSTETFNSSDGTQSAIMFVGNAGNMRLFQDVDIPVGATTLSWDMRWHNTAGAWAAGFGSGQNIQVHLRNPADDSVLTTVFEAADPLPTISPNLVNFTADISAFAGQTVRVDFFPNTFNFCQWFQFDNIVIN